MPADNLREDILQGVKKLLDQQSKEAAGFFDKQTKEVKELLAEQTVVILNAVDEKIKNLDLKFSDKFDKIMTALDKYSERVTTLETEFTVMRHDINRVKKVIKEKLGIDLT